ncbi:MULTISPECIES: threonine synthase [Haloferax]|uniref:Pyridoxal-phosphate dependent enzyme n=2 Tax=Haloferax TaxID=2251 RepID=A0A6G1Z764_9EURY|nr:MULTISPECIES: threonine synthase [Haloferax]KAB1185081.1 pyridoxal-phosphate dependent enzyme [Haloferax sp. CBA1149]MRW82258.1 pyridoxal-phosphate dependent enzyme [Haloferax marinisediminis]
MTHTRVCYDCGARTTAPAARCDCGEPLWLDTDPGTFDWDDVSDEPGMWRYESLLPVSRPAGLSAAAGGTPMVSDASIDAVAGTNVHLKLEGEHPTGSFKDRGSALGIAAVARGLAGDVSAVGTVSHGNMAMSTAAFAAAADLPCLVLVPDDIPPERLDVIDQFDPTSVTVAGDYGRLYEQTLERGPDHGIVFLNSDVPLRVEGQKTTALEICEAFAPDTPDALVMPVSSGGHASGAWKALRELSEAGAIDRIPALYFVQAAACSPIADAFEADADEVTRVVGGETIAYSIANPDPPSGTRALRAARETGGAVVAVDDDAIRTAQRALAVDAGITVEPSSATALAGIQQLVERGDIDSDDHVTAVLTGTGLKEASASGTRSPSTDHVELANLEDYLTGFTSTDD